MPRSRRSRWVWLLAAFVMTAIAGPTPALAKGKKGVHDTELKRKLKDTKPDKRLRMLLRKGAKGKQAMDDGLALHGLNPKQRFRHGGVLAEVSLSNLPSRYGTSKRSNPTRVIATRSNAWAGPRRSSGRPCTSPPMRRPSPRGR